jgi:hypothetical protein
MSGELLKTASLKNKTSQVVHPTYQYMVQPPTQGQGNYPITTASGPTVMWQLSGSSVVNLSKSYLRFQFLLPAQGATPNFGYVNINGMKFIDTIIVYPQAGPQVCNLTFAAQYLDCIVRKVPTLQDTLTLDSVAPYTVANTPNGSFYEGTLCPNNAAAGAATVRLDNTSAARYTEAKYFVASGSNADMYLDVAIPFQNIYDTILSVDKDMMWKTNLNINITFNSLAKIAWLSTSGSNPTSGAAPALAVDAGGESAAIINPYIWLAVQKNEELNKIIGDKVNSKEGYKFPIPWVTSSQVSIAAGANNPQVFLNPGLGSHVKKIIWGVYPQNPATPNLYYDKNNLAGAKISQFRTNINNIPIQLTPFVPANGDDWLACRDKLRGSEMQSFNEYLYNWSYQDDFTCLPRKDLYSTIYPDIPYDNLIDGLPLLDQQQILYNVISTSAVALTNYFFIVSTKHVTLADGVVTVQ